MVWMELGLSTLYAGEYLLLSQTSIAMGPSRKSKVSSIQSYDAVAPYGIDRAGPEHFSCRQVFIASVW